MVAAVLSLNTALSQSAETKESIFQFTFIPPLGTQGIHAGHYSNGFSFNLLAGLSQNERHFTLGSIANIVRNNAAGFQLAGVANLIENNTNGFQLAGVSNIVGNNGKGMLLSGVLNTSKDYNGFQLAGVGNIAGDINSFQFAGVFNKAKKVKGVQFAGIMNIADDSDYPIGLINIIKNGEMGIGVSYNETGSTVISLRSGSRIMYGIIGVGYNYRSNSDASFVIETGYGVHINCSENFRINTEAKAQFLSMFKKHENTQYSLAILPALKISSNFEVFAGPSINYLRSEDTSNGKLFPNDTSINLWKSFGASKLEQLYIGFSVGTQFLF